MIDFEFTLNNSKKNNCIERETAVETAVYLAFSVISSQKNLTYLICSSLNIGRHFYQKPNQLPD